MIEDAANEIEKIAPDEKTCKEVMEFRLELAVVAKSWDMAATLGKVLTRADPDSVQLWIQYAYAVRRLESVENAEKILLRAMEIHPEEPMIRFNLACYASVTGRIAEAKKRLGEAIEINEGMRQLALDDEDLKPLWDAITE